MKIMVETMPSYSGQCLFSYEKYGNSGVGYPGDQLKPDIDPYQGLNYCLFTKEPCSLAYNEPCCFLKGVENVT